MSVVKPRPQSWKPQSHVDKSGAAATEKRAITTPGRLDISPVKKALLGLQIDDVGGDVVVSSKREGKHVFYIYIIWHPATHVCHFILLYEPLSISVILHLPLLLLSFIYASITFPMKHFISACFN